MQSIEAIQALTKQRVKDGRAPGLAVGVLTDAGREVATAGVKQVGSSDAIARDTLFEIGSITKVFTGLLLADATLRGELALDQPINDFLPDGGRAPDVQGEPIRLVDLATHASGLPSFMDGAPPFDDPWAAYTRDALLADVAAFKPTQAIGAGFRYSNTAYGLVGIALERATGLAYEPLLRRRVLDPLGMSSTAITLTPALEARAATPHGLYLTPVHRLAVGPLAPAGSLWSDADDLLTLMAAAAGLIETPLKPAFDHMLTVRRPGPPAHAGEPTPRQAIGWVVVETPLGTVLGHAGGTVGMGTFALVCPAQRAAITVLGNASSGPGAFAFHLFEPSVPVVEPPMPAPLSPIDEDRSLYPRLVGRYAIGPNAECRVEADETGLIGISTDGPRLRLRRCGEAQFFNAAFGATADFEFGPDGRALAIAFSVPGMASARGTRVD